jgi:beta-phosphoglucomutase-like phosphatase (HAD superfamily)
MPIRYKCLFLDHDDTAVNSAAAVHYPAHLEALSVLRPDRPKPRLEDWILVNFHGIMEYFTEELGLTPAELEMEYEIWRKHSVSRAPEFFPGFLDVIAAYRRAGGKVAVISHSEADVIESHYRRAGVADAVPDLIFGWSNDAERRKPSPLPVREALSAFGLRPEEALIVDDLKPGVLMSQATGVPAAGAGWGYDIPEIKRYMQEHTLAYFESIDEFKKFLFLPLEA